MTYSIIARDEKTGDFASAAATGNLLVGQFVPHIDVNLGIVNSQGFLPFVDAPKIIFNHLENKSAKESLECLKNDSSPQVKEAMKGAQLLVMDNNGEISGFTGEKNLSYAGVIIKDGLAVAGNWLESENTLKSMIKAFHDTKGHEMAFRLISALKAAESAGGDSRGLMSASVNVFKKDTWPLNLRVDFSKSPLFDLEYIYKKTQEKDYKEFIRNLPIGNYK